MNLLVWGCRNGKAREGQAILLFKKRMFRETDESITESQFITLSFVQARLSGHHALMVKQFHTSLVCKFKV